MIMHGDGRLLMCDGGLDVAQAIPYSLYLSLFSSFSLFDQ